MIALNLLEVKECMSKLLLSEIFDSFLFIEGDIVTFNTFHIDGYLKKEFFDTDVVDTFTERDYSFWKDVREFCYSIIKGKKTPLRFHLVLKLSNYNTAKLLQQEGLPFTSNDVQGLYMNLKFDGQLLECITGTSLKTFTMDKTLELAWDSMVQRFFKHQQIVFEIL
ncbi:DUF5721 family protein [Lachnospiraceae bacterium LCP25S3_G4]